MAELFTTSDLMTYVLAYIDQASSALHDECGLGLLEYRMLAYLADHVDGVGPSSLARILTTSPASITIAANKLAGKGLVSRGGAETSSRHLGITKAGIDASRDADIVLASAHEQYFSPLPPHLKATVDIGSIVTNQTTPENVRIRDGHFFSAFETLHAFLTVERLLTVSTHKFGLSLTQFRVLFEIDRQGGTSQPGTLSHALLLAPASIAHALRGLESAGRVVRTRPATDKRMADISLTETGRELYARALQGVEMVFTTDIRESTRRERDVYKDAAMIMVSSLQKSRGEAG